MRFDKELGGHGFVVEGLSLCAYFSAQVYFFSWRDCTRLDMVSNDFSTLSSFWFFRLLLLTGFQEHLFCVFLHLEMNWDGLTFYVMTLIYMSLHLFLRLASFLALVHVPLAYHLFFSNKVDLLSTCSRKAVAWLLLASIMTVLALDSPSILELFRRGLWTWVISHILALVTSKLIVVRT